MACSECQGKPVEKKCNTCGALPRVIEIHNEECPILFHNVEVEGNVINNPPYIGQFKNALAVYKEDGAKVLFSSDGVPAPLSGTTEFNSILHRPKYDGEEMTSDTDIPNVETTVAEAVAAETEAREAADAELTSSINSVADALATEVSTRAAADTGLSNRIDDESTARQSADAALGSRIDTTDSNLASEREARVAADDALSSSVDSLSSSLSAETEARTAADTALQTSVDTIDAAIDTDVMTDLVLDPNTSTTVVQLDTTKKNLKTSVTVTGNVPLPVANATQAGVMNVATYNAITKNTQDIANIIGEVVAITGLSASPSQNDLTTAWLNASGESELINGAGIYDVTNSKTWTYYSNTSTWYALDATGSVSVNTFTNAAAGIIKGSTNVGQVFAENDGTGSVNGWDALKAQADNATSKLATVESGAQVNVQSDWAETDSTADDYIKNKPTIDNALSSSSTNAVENQAVTAEFNEVAYVGDTLSTPSDIAYVATDNIQDGAVTADKIDFDVQSIGVVSGIEVYYYKVNGLVFLTIHSTTAESHVIAAGGYLILGTLPSDARPKMQGAFMGGIALATGTDKVIDGIAIGATSAGVVQVQNKSGASIDFGRVHASGFYPTSSITS